MTPELTYNPVKALTLRDHLATIYFRHEEKLCAAFFVAVVGLVVTGLYLHA